MKPILRIAAWSAGKLPAPIKRQIYEFLVLARFLRRVLNRSAPSGETEAVIAAGGLAGFRMLLDLQTEKDYWLGTYEPDLQAAVVQLVKPGMVVYDVGANIGYVSLLLARQVGEAGRVYAFEALPANLERLRKNLSMNELSHLVEVVPAAIIESSRMVQFLVGPSHGMGKASGSAGRIEYDYQESFSVEGLSLDDFIFSMNHPVPQVIKLDIEGGEVLALPGMRRLLNENRPLVLMELHGPLAAQAAVDEFTNAGYQLNAMQLGYPAIDSIEELSWKAYVVAIPEPRGPSMNKQTGGVRNELSSREAQS